MTTPQPPPNGSILRRTLRLLTFLVLVLVAVYLLRPRAPRAEAKLPPAKPAFSGKSKNLKHTQIVATLDTPMEKGKNVIWCASFEAAWKQLQHKLAKGPVVLSDSPALAASLNASYTPGPELPPKALYGAAGWEDKGIIQQIRKDVAQQFPGAPTPEFPGIAEGSFLAYSRPGGPGAVRDPVPPESSTAALSRE